MRKAQFKTQAEKVTFNRGCSTKGFYFYQSCQYRWEDSNDPIMDDVTIHLIEKEAIQAAKLISCKVGYSPIVESIFISYDDFNEGIEFGEDFELTELYKKFPSFDVETIYNGGECLGESLEGAIIVSWNYEKYVGYSRNFQGVRYAYANETEADLITGNEERTFRGNLSVLLTAKAIKGMDAEELLEAVATELLKTSWKWNYSKNAPSREKIIEGLDITQESDNG